LLDFLLATDSAQALPDHEGAEHRERKNADAEIEPGAIAAGIFRKDEEMNREPEADRKTDGDPGQIAGRFPDCPDVLDLGAGDARRDDDENGDENGSHRQAAEPDGLRQFTGSFHLVHGQLAWANCASVMSIYSSLSASARASRPIDARAAP